MFGNRLACCCCCCCFFETLEFRFLLLQVKYHFATSSEIYIYLNFLYFENISNFIVLHPCTFHQTSCLIVFLLTFDDSILKDRRRRTIHIQQSKRILFSGFFSSGCTTLWLINLKSINLMISPISSNLCQYVLDCWDKGFR